MKILRLLLLAGLATVSLNAQQTVSIRKAAFYSLLVPGAGQYYIGETTRGGIFIGAELASWFAYWQFNREIDWTTDNYQRFASVEAGIPADSPEWVYERAQDYASSDDFNALVTQDARNYYLLYKNDPDSYQDYLDRNLVPDENAWSWSDHDAWLHFHRLRVHKQDVETYTKLAIGAALFNRMVSVIDAARLARKINRGGANLGSLTLQPDWKTRGMMLQYEYRF